jgi:hypothetical protein
MSKEISFVWQCTCGHVSREELPEDCPKCYEVGKFNRVPEDMLDDAQEDEILSLKPLEEFEEKEEDFYDD